MRKKILIILMMLLFAVCSVQAVAITFSTSGTIGAGDTYDTVYVENDGTVVDMTGGQIVDLLTSDISTFNMSGGQITGLGSHIGVGALSTFNMLNGIADLHGLYLEGAGAIYSAGGTASISGGTLSAETVKIYPDAKLTLANAGVYFGMFNIMEDGQMDIFSGNVEISHASVAYGYYVGDDYMDVGATINVHGYDFNYDPTGGAYSGGILTGYLSDGNPFSIDQVSEMEYTSFNLIPEPATLLLFGLGALLLRKRN